MSLALPSAGAGQEAEPGLRLACLLLWSYSAEESPKAESLLWGLYHMSSCPSQLTELPGPGSHVLQDIVFQ